jgi:hypothetical protein
VAKQPADERADGLEESATSGRTAKRRLQRNSKPVNGLEQLALGKFRNNECSE